MKTARRVVLVLGVCGVLAGCKVKKNEECVEPVKEAAGAKDNAGEANASGASAAASVKKIADEDADWCRACVVGPHGFMSCQRRSATDPSETLESLREKARVAACTDSGFSADACPKDKVIGLVCKGDPEPKDKREAGTKLLKALKSSGPLVLTSDKEKIERLRKKMKQKDPSDAEPQTKAGGDKVSVPPSSSKE